MAEIWKPSILHLTLKQRGMGFVGWDFPLKSIDAYQDERCF